MTTSPGRVVHSDEVEPITWSGEEAGRFLLRSEDTGGQYSFYEVTVPAGQGSHFHVHEDTDEAFYIVEGEFEIHLGDVVHRAPAGTVVYGPRGVVHAFRNTLDEPGRMLCVTTPGGIERFFEELSTLMKQDPPADWSQMQELATRHRIVAFPDQERN
ncbi:MULTISPECIES: cupin domain-containing protein [Kitasatospora]|uniref:Cupin domain-containing protein n=1 Tax=Kitasatospora cathayae TaxID=3004092 RepID=A0ABY7Q6E3_9ACTN|nr:cupin domain-containing protein [Kitasatospora sp. HUAS 3-15]WBP88275.1 cupin domain-containing protein [Kitasatospora sp. HUAS 3-15]